MVVPDTSTAEARTGLAARLVEQVVALTRLVHGLKAQESRRSAHGLLFPLLALGPMRVTALAEVVHADVSTVSRQVGDLVREGLVRREPDPDDGRASLLAATDAGGALAEWMRQQRALRTAEALAGWSSEDLERFADLFTRFTADVAAGLGQPVPSHAPPRPTPEDR